MKLWTLMENTACCPDLQSEHGLSFYIETNGKRILFDAGQSGAFADNAKELGIDLEKVDLAVLSHGHYDHGNGMLRFLEENSSAPIYVSDLAAGAYYNAKDSYIGLAPELKDNPRLIFAGDVCSLGEGITLLSCRSKEPVEKIDSAGLQKKAGDTFVPDDFLHEQYLLIEEAGKRIVISGCSHRGILNIAGWLPCDVLIGGFHFMKKDPAGEEIMAAAEALLRYDTVYHTCHCTGELQFAAMKEKMGDRLHYLAAGSYLEVGKTI